MTRFSSYLPIRIAALAVLFVLELLAITIPFDAADLSGANMVTAFMSAWGAWILHAIVASAGLYVALRYFTAGTLPLIIDESPAPLVSWRLLACHAGLLAFFYYLSTQLFAGPYARNTAVAVLWLAAGTGAIFLAAAAFVTVAQWAALFRGAGKLWLWAVAAGVTGCVVGNEGRLLWGPVARFTFAVVKLILSLFFSNVISVPATMTIGTPTFNVEIAPQCSGLEGMGLMLVFTLAWLAIFRNEFRFPQALLLAPVGMGAMFLLNTLRIAILIFIGNAGAASVALGGFHSQAGWIAFTVVALVLPIAAARIPWISAVRPEPVRAAPVADNPTARYVLPLMAILAAAMITRAASGSFEWLYPLRFFAAAAVLWRFRRQYLDLDWKFGWFAIAAGAAVFGMWMALERFSGASAASPVAAGLTGLGFWPRIAWVACRILAAVVTVPIAEELAFRGFLPRRLINVDFERVSLRNIPLVPILVSSLAFGLMHGQRWLAGAVAGLIYAWALSRRGRMGDAVAAHAVTNLLLAVWVLWRGEYSLW